MEDTESINKKTSELRESIMDAAMEVFHVKGMRFTMDDVAKKLHMSKKTLYTVFADKETLIYETVKTGFDAVKISENAIANRNDLDIIEKIKQIIIVMPEQCKQIDFTKFHELKEKYPKIYSFVEDNLESGWELTFSLLEEAKIKNRIKDISLPVFQSMISGAMESFLTKDTLHKNKIGYLEALSEMIDILMTGIVCE